MLGAQRRRGPGQLDRDVIGVRPIDLGETQTGPLRFVVFGDHEESQCLGEQSITEERLDPAGTCSGRITRVLLREQEPNLGPEGLDVDVDGGSEGSDCRPIDRGDSAVRLEPFDQWLERSPGSEDIADTACLDHSDDQIDLALDSFDRSLDVLDRRLQRHADGRILEGKCPLGAHRRDLPIEVADDLLAVVHDRSEPTGAVGDDAMFLQQPKALRSVANVLSARRAVGETGCVDGERLGCRRWSERGRRGRLRLMDGGQHVDHVLHSFGIPTQKESLLLLPHLDGDGLSFWRWGSAFEPSHQVHRATGCVQVPRHRWRVKAPWDDVTVENYGPGMESEDRLKPDEWMKWRFNDPQATVGKPGSRGHHRYVFARHQARQLIERISKRPIVEFRPTGSVSLRMVLFTAERQDVSDAAGRLMPRDPDGDLYVVVGGHEPDAEVEKVLPYALEVAGDRDLIFVIPEGTQWPILARLPWIDHHVRVFTHSLPVGVDDALVVGHDLVEQVVPLRIDVVESAHQLTEFGAYELSPAHLGWVDDLVTWADNHPRLLASHRPAYLGWQAEGRLVLRIARATGGKLRVSAGVRPGSDSPNASGLEVILDGPLIDPEPLREAVRQAIQMRLAGQGPATLEHRLQARMQMLPPERRMGLETLVPEFPAVRPRPGGLGAGLVDFLGVDGNRRIVVVETKVGASEPTVLLQALDYWVWAESNRTELAERLGADPTLRVGLSVVVAPGPDGRLLQRHNRFVLDRLSRSVPLTIWKASNDLQGELHITRVRSSSLRKNSRFSDRMRLRAQSAARLAQPPSGDLSSIEGIQPSAVWAAEQLEATGKLHSHVGAAHSSQRFALDLFGPLGSVGVERLLARFFGPMASASSPSFEWTDPDRLLQESTPGRPYQTQIDVLLAGKTVDGRTVALFVEVKLTEAEFGGCSHAEIAPPELRTNCSTSGPFGAEPSSCWQLRNRDEGKHRRYADVLSIENKTVGIEPGCWFLKRNQPMRIAATAQAARQAGTYDECFAVLTIPQAHTSMRRRWQESIDMIGSSVLGWLDPEVVSAALSPAAAAHVIDRYGLGEPDPQLRDVHSNDTRSWDLAAELKLAMWDSSRLIETHPGGGMYDCLSFYQADQSHLLDLNREGSLHSFMPVPAHDGETSLRTVWRDLAAGRLDEVMAWCRSIPDLPIRPHDPRHEWIRIMPRLAYAYEGRASWKNGVFDTSGYPGDPYQRDLFDAMGIGDSNPMRGMDELGAAYGYWFLVSNDGRPLAAINIETESGWLPNGEKVDLASARPLDTFATSLGL